MRHNSTRHAKIVYLHLIENHIIVSRVRETKIIYLKTEVEFRTDLGNVKKRVQNITVNIMFIDIFKQQSHFPSLAPSAHHLHILYQRILTSQNQKKCTHTSARGRSHLTNIRYMCQEDVVIHDKYRIYMS